ncbi:MAG: tripartite tricarboxylate transporter permease [Burkholderiales bacterium]|jgi:putative tricarboxylic transport membrane protein|nr:tripartite tricarboxylate transporter permease [Burkholderiales bacterium]
MIETFNSLMMGFSVAFQPQVLMYAFFGCIIGTLVGMMPGLGPLAGISLLLPATFGLNPIIAIVLLSGVYYGAMYGGSTTSILMRIPGEAASVMTCVDGYAMTQQGRAGPALAIAAIGSFVAGTLGVIGLMLLAPTLADFALRFGPPEYTALLLMGLFVLAYMSGGSMLKTLAMAVFGLLLGMIGIDVMSGYTRFSFGITELGDGVGIVPVAVGLFGISEILMTAGQADPPKVQQPSLRQLIPTAGDLRHSAAPILRGSLLGFMIGIIPGSAHIISSFVSYGMERRLSKNPERFGHGAIEGVAGPESANNAAATGAFVPMLALGIPTGPVTAVMLAAIMVHGILPGPMLIQQQPDLFWGFVASMYVGNVVLLVLNLPMVGLFVNLLRIPYAYLYPCILAFCIVGCYSVSNNTMDVWIMLAMGVVGYVLRKFGFDLAPVALGLVLGPMLELSLRQALAMSGGEYSIFLHRPIAVTMLVIAAVMLLFAIKPLIFKGKDWRSKVGLDEPADS